MAELTTLSNIGKETAEKLNAVGINNAEELIYLGSKQAFFKLKSKYKNICLVHLYALEGAILNINLKYLNKKTKKELKQFNDELK